MNLQFAALLLFSSMPAQQHCSSDEFVTSPPPEADVVVLGTLAQRTPGDGAGLAIFNADETRALVVKVRVDDVLQGSFSVTEGAEFLLAVHSVVLQFGADYIGESYQFGMRTKGDDYELVHLAVPEENLYAVMVRVQEIISETEPGKSVLDLSDGQGRTVRVSVESGKVPPELAGGGEPTIGIPVVPDRESKLTRGSELCLVLVRRGEREESPLRLVRLYGEW